MRLELFPPGGLDSGVLSTVLIGVLVVLFFNRRFGWVASGLVIPGYLVPLLMTRPVGVLLILIEATVTWALGRLICWMGERHGWFCQLFGRDRFFLLIVLSVAVRLGFDGWLWPILASALRAHDWPLPPNEDLHTIGLIVIALTANLFWKPGLLRGAGYLATTVGLTWAIVAGLLVPFTNFSVGGLAFLYEDVASSVLASPKAYILLISSAFIASRMNLFYGWEFNGILLPSLLALQWLQPDKLLATIIEIIIVFLVGSALLRSRWLRDYDLSGARLVATFFLVGFGYKMLLGWTLAYAMPQVKVSDHYAFGYLLSALLAAKMYDTGMPLRIVRATVQTSMLGAILATLVGFAFSLMPGPTGLAAPPAASAERRSLGEVLAAFQVAAYGNTVSTYQQQPVAADLGELEGLLKRWLEGEPPAALASKARRWAWQFSDGWWVLQARHAPGWGLLLLRSRTDGSRIIEVPESLYELGALDVALSLSDLLEASAIIVIPNGLDDRQTAGRQLLKLAHAALGEQPILRVRAPPRGASLATVDDPDERAASQLTLAGQTGTALPIAQLERLLQQPLAVDWGRASGNLLGVDAELRLSRYGVRQVLARAGAAEQGVAVAEVATIDGYVESWLLQAREAISRRGESPQRAPLEVPEMLYLDNEVLAPINRMVALHATEWNAEQLQELRFIASRADRLQMGLSELRESGGRRYLSLASRRPAEDAARAALIVWRLGAVEREWMIQAPKPLLERGAYEFAADLYARSRARLLLIAAAHPYASGLLLDPSRRGDADTFFNLAHQLFLRDQPNLGVVQVRTRLGEEMAQADLILQPAEGDRQATASIFANSFVELLAGSGLTYAWASGQPETRRWNARPNAQARMRRTHDRAEIVIAWLRPDLARRYQYDNSRRALEQQFDALGLTLQTAVMADWLPQQIWSEAVIDQTLRTAFEGYASNHDIASLAGLQKAGAGLILRALIDPRDGSHFLALSDGGRLLAVANLEAIGDLVIPTSTDGAAAALLDGRARLLHGEGWR